MQSLTYQVDKLILSGVSNEMTVAIGAWHCCGQNSVAPDMAQDGIQHYPSGLHWLTRGGKFTFSKSVSQ